MKPQFSPESTDDLQAAIDLLERVYRRECHQDATFHLGKLSVSIGEVRFVMQSTSKRPMEQHPVRVYVMEEVAS